MGLQRGDDALVGPNTFLTKRRLVADDEIPGTLARTRLGARTRGYRQFGLRLREFGKSTLEGRRAATDNMRLAPARIEASRFNPQMMTMPGAGFATPTDGQCGARLRNACRRGS
jgi:hypothetical protein